MTNSNQLYLATFYRDNQNSWITAVAHILNAPEAEEWFRKHQESFATIYPDAKDDEENQVSLTINESYLSYQNLDSGDEYRFEITPLSAGVYHSLKN